MAEKFIKEKEIIQKISDGWELSFSRGWRDSPNIIWIQKGKSGFGGETIKVHHNTFFSMLKRGVIVKSRRDYPNSVYKLRKSNSSD